MPVTKQTYTINANHTRTEVAAALRSALIDAGLMTEWYDSFSISSSLFRVLRIQHDSTKTYGTSFYYFFIQDNRVSVGLATGWNPTGATPANVPTGTQFLDYHYLPANVNPGNFQDLTPLFTNYSTTSNLTLTRFTSQSDSKQSWFVFGQSSSLLRSQPFSFLHKDTALHPWLDLNKGCISGFSRARASVADRAGFLNFTIEENLRRCLSFGSTLSGNTSSGAFSQSFFHNLRLNVYAYFGVGSQSGGDGSNWGGSGSDHFNQPADGRSLTAAFPLPVGRNSTNPAYTADYVPICSDVPWSYYTPTRLASDFGICMSYSANDLALGSKIIVQSTTNEWEVLDFANNASINVGASSSFVARII